MPSNSNQAGHLTSGPVWRHDDPPTPARAFSEALGSSELWREEWDVAVVGGGLTGLTTALLLARAGRSVVLLEAHRLGSGTTGASTAKVSLLQGTTMSGIRRSTSDRTLRAYAEGNREAQAWVERYADEHAVAVQHRAAYTYATTIAGARAVRAEIEAVRASGLTVEWVETTTLPFPVTGAARMVEQLQLDPMDLVQAIAADAEQHGALLVEGVTAQAVAGSDPVLLTTDAGEVRARRVVVATNLPFLDRGGHFARAEPQRSYALAYRTPRALVDGMYLSADEPSRSLRDVPGSSSDGPLLLVGGNGHVTGRASSPLSRLAELDRWTQDWFPGAELVDSWSAQDYQTNSRIPWAGPLLPRQEAVLVAGGYGKWGMTNAVAAALAISGRILDGHLPWADELYAWGRPTLSAAGAFARLNANVGKEMSLGWLRPALHPHRADPGEGEGVVTLDHVGTPTATARVDGELHRVSAVCPHLGGIVRWNDAERSWDCPLHGSRFAATGDRIEGPATCGLTRRD